MIFAVYKPKGPTSYDIIREIKKIVGKDKKIGHAGTLDPLASGVLVIGIGREATKKLPEVVGSEKEYIAKIKLGETSTTDDEEGEKSKTKNTLFSNSQEFKNRVRETIKEFIGKIEQIPPAYSAIKIKGKEAYKRVRKGEAVEMKPREVEIKNIEILNYECVGSPEHCEGGAYLTIKVITGPGVYIRSLARDIGANLGVGGYLVDLERTRVGDFKKEAAVPLEKVRKLISL